MPHSYVTLSEMKLITGAKRSDDTEKDAFRMTVAASISLAIDKYCNRRFQPYLATRTFTADRTDKLVVPDLLSITTLKTDLNLDGVYEEVWSASNDYWLTPEDAQIDELPYTAIRTRSYTRQFFPYNFEMGVQVDGKWGYWEYLEDTGTQVNGVLTSTQKTVVVDDAAPFDVGATILVGAEQMYIRAVNAATKTLTVVRAQNGTTAAIQADDSAISIYTYPDIVLSATRLWASRLYRRTEAPLGMINAPGDIGWRAVYIPRLDVDATRMLAQVTRTKIA